MTRRALLIAGLLVATLLASAHGASRLEVIYVGGWDCPPCLQWKKTQKPRWVASPEFRKVTWVEVEAPRLKEAYEERYWPLQLQPLLATLPFKSGTPRFLIVRDGKVVSNENHWADTLATLKKLLGE